MSVSQTLNTEDAGIQVAVRVRPFLNHEVGQQHGVRLQDQAVIIQNSREERAFSADVVLDSSERGRATQAVVYDSVGRDLVQAALQGSNVCLFAYGHTGSGKTYTVMGEGYGSAALPTEGYCPEEGPGLLPRALEDVFFQPGVADFRYILSFYEIYNEKIIDLLASASPDSTPINSSRGKPTVHFHPRYGAFVSDLNELQVENFDEAIWLLRIAVQGRQTAATAVNDRSSRSHALCQLRFEAKGVSAGARKTSSLTFVDLAGREQEKATQCRAERFKELTLVNRSLFYLARCIRTLATGGTTSTINPGSTWHHFRNSKLTMLLGHALSGNSKTALLGTVSPSRDAFEDSLSTLRFCESVKKVQARPMLIELSAEDVVRELQFEVQRLESELSQAVTGREHVARQLNEAESMMQHYKRSWETAVRGSREQRAVSDISEDGLPLESPPPSASATWRSTQDDSSPSSGHRGMLSRSTTPMLSHGFPSRSTTPLLSQASPSPPASPAYSTKSSSRGLKTGSPSVTPRSPLGVAVSEQRDYLHKDPFHKEYSQVNGSTGDESTGLADDTTVGAESDGDSSLTHSTEGRSTASLDEDLLRAVSRWLDRAEGDGNTAKAAEKLLSVTKELAELRSEGRQRRSTRSKLSRGRSSPKVGAGPPKVEVGWPNSTLLLAPSLPLTPVEEENRVLKAALAESNAQCAYLQRLASEQHSALKKVESFHEESVRRREEKRIREERIREEQSQSLRASHRDEPVPDVATTQQDNGVSSADERALPRSPQRGRLSSAPSPSQISLEPSPCSIEVQSQTSSFRPAPKIRPALSRGRMTPQASSPSRTPKVLSPTSTARGRMSHQVSESAILGWLSPRSPMLEARPGPVEQRPVLEPKQQAASNYPAGPNPQPRATSSAAAGRVRQAPLQPMRLVRSERYLTPRGCNTTHQILHWASP